MSLDAPHDPAVTHSPKHQRTADQHLDVLIIGAGLSGIASAYYLQKNCPDRSFALLEARQSMGGTWDLFRYPGIRSDSDLYTFGFSFAPWEDDRTIADGASILSYLKRTAAKFGIDRKIRYGHAVTRASWDSSRQLWTVDINVGPGGAPVRYTCSFLYMCTGYYEYGEGYMPRWPGIENFRGTLIHPQRWPEDLHYTGRRVVVIGSGATAVTIVPEMAKEAAHVTMLQRSPSYIMAIPSVDWAASWMRRKLSERLSYRLSRLKYIGLAMLFFSVARSRPEYTKRQLMQLAKNQLPPDFDADRHLTPRYEPWDQRVCFVPDGDLFQAIGSGKVSIVTDEIETFTEAGVKVKSGETLDADIIVAATGLNMALMGGVDLAVDGKPVDISSTHFYRGMMLSDVPNFVYTIGYTNAPWTLRCELTAGYFCRILNRMKARGYSVAVPRIREDVVEAPSMGLASGYVQRALSSLPKQGVKKPWKLYQNYVRDLLSLKFASIEDRALEFIRPSQAKAAPAAMAEQGAVREDA